MGEEGLLFRISLSAAGVGSAGLSVVSGVADVSGVVDVSGVDSGVVFLSSSGISPPARTKQLSRSTSRRIRVLGDKSPDCAYLTR